MQKYLVLILSVLLFSSAMAREVRVGVFDYPPAVFMDADGVCKGFFVDLLKATAEGEGWTLRFVHGTWQDGLDRVRSGEVDLLTSVAYTKERAQHMDYGKEHILTVWGEVYVRRSSSLDTIFELRGKHVGIMGGDYNAAVFKNHAESFEIGCQYHEYNSFEAVLEALQKGDVDAGVINSTFGAGMGRRYSVKGTGVVFNPFNIYFTTAKGQHPDILQALDKRLVEWKADADSLYYQGLQRWLRRDISIKHVVPPLVWQIGVILMGAFVLALGMSVILRKQVQRATASLLVEQERLRESRAQYHQLVENTADLITSTDEGGSFLYVNHAAQTVFGIPPEDCVGKSAFDFIHVDDRELTKNWFQKQVLRKQEQASIENRQVDSAGNARTMLWNCTFHYNDSGNLIRVDGIARDITKRKALEEELAHSRRMESIGQLAGGIAHDFNNILCGIMGATDLLAKRVNGEKERKCVDLIAQAGNRAADLTGQLLSFSRKAPVDRIPIDLHDVIKDACMILSSAVDKRVEIVQNLAATQSVVLGDFTQMQSAIINLGINAGHAMPEGGGLTIVTANESASGASDMHSQQKPAEKNICITVSDTGCGIPNHLLDRIFEPFFTTRDRGEGTGLGLAAVYGTVQDHKGDVTVESCEGHGTTFCITLPCVDTVAQEPEGVTQVQQGSGCILLVDDEEIIRQMAREALETLGYSVLEASNGAEGVDAYSTHRSRIDLVLLDQAMPKMDGLTCLRRLKAINPEARVILSSGYIQEATVSELREEGIIGFLPKPYHPADLAKAVSRALAG